MPTSVGWEGLLLYLCLLLHATAGFNQCKNGSINVKGHGLRAAIVSGRASCIVQNHSLPTDCFSATSLATSSPNTISFRRSPRNAVESLCDVYYKDKEHIIIVKLLPFVTETIPAGFPCRAGERGMYMGETHRGPPENFDTTGRISTSVVL